jgi:hypothetical protein
VKSSGEPSLGIEFAIQVEWNEFLPMSRENIDAIEAAARDVNWNVRLLAQLTKLLQAKEAIYTQSFWLFCD